jgi:hypothetical protein
MAIKIISVVISGVDRLSGVIGQGNKALDTLQTRVTRLGQGMAVGGAGLLAGGLGAAHALGLSELPGQLIRAERNLISLGNVGELTAAQLRPIGKEIFALQKVTNQTQGDLFAGVNTLVASGLSPKLAVDFLKPIGMAATAEDADIRALAQTTFTVYDNLKVPVNDLNKALNIMTLAGKRGRFELKDMAREFPALSAGARLLGLADQKSALGLGGGLRTVSQMSAGLQIAMKGAGTPEQAANNMANFYQKVFSNDTMVNMKKITGDPMKLVKTWGAALKEGKDPMLETLGYLNQLTTFKDPAYKSAAIGKIFSDRQVQDFVKIMMPNLREYAKLRDEWAKSAPRDQDVIGKDYTRIMQSTAEQWKLMKINSASIIAPDLEGPLKKANSLLVFFNNHAALTKGLLVGIGGAIAGGGLLVGLGSMAFALTSVIKLFSSTLTTAIVAKTIVGGLGTGVAAAMPVIAGLITTGFAIAVTDGLTKGFLGYKVGLIDIVSKGGYANAMETKRQEEMKITLRKLYPNKTEEQIDALVGAHTVDTSTPAASSSVAKPEGYQPSYAPGYGAYYAATAANRAPEGHIKVELGNLPAGSKVTVEKEKNMSLDVDRGRYK